MRHGQGQFAGPPGSTENGGALDAHHGAAPRGDTMTRYQQLADDLARRIAEGTLRPGERVPSVRHACRSHDA